MITVENLTKTFQQNKRTTIALDNVSMDVPEGAAFGVVGASGAGKSTLARCIGLLDRPDSGAIKVGGTDLVGLEGTALRSARRRIGVVPQDDALLTQRTTAGNIGLPLEAAGANSAQRRSRVAELLDLVGLTEKATIYPDQLSHAQRQRAAVGRALATRPSVLLADEPTAALDSTTSESVLTVLDRVRSELGVTVLVATHDMSVVRRLADDVAVLREGSVVEQGKVLDLVSEPGSYVGASLLPDLDQDQQGTGTVRHDVVAEVVLVGFAAVGALLPEASGRFDVDLSILGGGYTRLGDTPVAKFRVGLTGERSEVALKWMVEHDAHVRRAPVCVERGVAA